MILMRTCMDDDGDDIPPASPAEKLIEQLPKGASLVSLLSILTNIERWIDLGDNSYYLKTEVERFCLSYRRYYYFIDIILKIFRFLF